MMALGGICRQLLKWRKDEASARVEAHRRSIVAAPAHALPDGQVVLRGGGGRGKWLGRANVTTKVQNRFNTQRCDVWVCEVVKECGQTKNGEGRWGLIDQGL